MQVESWAFALDAKGLEVLANAGVFYLRTCKLCDDGIVVRAATRALACWLLLPMPANQGPSCAFQAAR